MTIRVERLYNAAMNVKLLPYANKRICVAVSGGKDSMALLHYIKKHGADYNITLCALNCDHGIRERLASATVRSLRHIAGVTA